jgi:iron complex transport system ATP-binding protein
MIDRVLLAARGVVVGYEGVTAVADVDLDVRAGELTALIGPNGAGKSTLLRALAGGISPRSGEISLGGRSIRGLDRAEIARQVAVVHQQVDVALGFTVEAVVAMGRAPHQGRWMRAGPGDADAVRAALEACDLVHLAARPVEALSGGEQRRVAIARALAQRADVLLLDEPTAHLDVRHAIEVLSVVRREVEERDVACVAVLHDLNLAAAFAERVVLLQAGRVVAAGSAEEVITRAALEAAFDAPLHVGDLAETGARFVVPAVRRGSRRPRKRDL